MKKSPTSPHLFIYKWNVSSVISILHRVTHLSVYFISLIFAVYFIIYAGKEMQGRYGVFGPAIDLARNFANNYPILGKFVIFSTLCKISVIITFNILSGFRYFIWSFGVGFNKKIVQITGHLIWIFSLGFGLYFGYFLYRFVLIC